MYFCNKMSSHYAQTLLDVCVAWCTWADMKLRIDWCTWADMKLRIDKCNMISIAKHSGQFLPYIFMLGPALLGIQLGNEFKYRGRIYNYNMDNQTAKSDLVKHIEDMFCVISSCRFGLR